MNHKKGCKIKERLVTLEWIGSYGTRNDKVAAVFARLLLGECIREFFELL
jgi:hypothetical protein